MIKKSITTPNAPQPIGPYSQGIVTGDLIFVSGQTPLDPAGGEIVPGGIKEQTRRVMDSIKAILAGQGLDLDHIVKTTIFLTDMADFSEVNEVYGAYFTQIPPARTTVQVAALPKGAAVEIEAVAVMP